MDMGPRESGALCNRLPGSTNRHAQVRGVDAMQAQPRAIVVMGIAGSGKTTVALALARHYGYRFLDADDFHTAGAKAQMAAGVPLTDQQRDRWVGLLERQLRKLAQQGHSSVMAFSGLRARHRQRLRESGVRTLFIFLHAAPTVIAARLAGRSNHFMSPHLLASQIDALQPPTDEPGVIAVEVSGPIMQVLDRVISAID